MMNKTRKISKQLIKTKKYFRRKKRKKTKKTKKKFRKFNNTRKIKGGSGILDSAMGFVYKYSGAETFVNKMDPENLIKVITKMKDKVQSAYSLLGHFDECNCYAPRKKVMKFIRFLDLNKQGGPAGNILINPYTLQIYINLNNISYDERDTKNNYNLVTLGTLLKGNNEDKAVHKEKTNAGYVDNLENRIKQLNTWVKENLIDQPNADQIGIEKKARYKLQEGIKNLLFKSGDDSSMGKTLGWRNFTNVIIDKNLTNRICLLYKSLICYSLAIYKNENFIVSRLVRFDQCMKENGNSNKYMKILNQTKSITRFVSNGNKDQTKINDQTKNNSYIIKCRSLNRLLIHLFFALLEKKYTDESEVVPNNGGEDTDEDEGDADEKDADKGEEDAENNGGEGEGEEDAENKGGEGEEDAETLENNLSWLNYSMKNDRIDTDTFKEYVKPNKGKVQLLMSYLINYTNKGNYRTLPPLGYLMYELQLWLNNKSLILDAIPDHIFNFFKTSLNIPNASIYLFFYTSIQQEEEKKTRIKSLAHNASKFWNSHSRAPPVAWRSTQYLRCFESPFSPDHTRHLVKEYLDQYLDQKIKSEKDKKELSTELLQSDLSDQMEKYSSQNFNYNKVHNFLANEGKNNIYITFSNNSIEPNNLLLKKGETFGEDQKLLYFADYLLQVGVNKFFGFDIPYNFVLGLFTYILFIIQLEKIIGKRLEENKDNEEGLKLLTNYNTHLQMIKPYIIGFRKRKRSHIFKLTLSKDIRGFSDWLTLHMLSMVQSTFNLYTEDGYNANLPFPKFEEENIKKRSDKKTIIREAWDSITYLMDECDALLKYTGDFYTHVLLGKMIKQQNPKAESDQAAAEAAKKKAEDQKVAEDAKSHPMRPTRSHPGGRPTRSHPGKRRVAGAYQRPHP